MSETSDDPPKLAGDRASARSGDADPEAPPENASPGGSSASDASTREQRTASILRPAPPGTGGPRGEASTFSPGEQVAGRYTIVRFIARGGMGEVFEAEDRELRERVALKTVRPEIAEDPRAAVERFKREIHLARKVTHPNVCRIFDVFHHHRPGGPDGGTEITFLGMELLGGETLSARLRRGGRMSASEALPLVIQMAEGLAAAHAAGVIHRDFKSQNVLLVPAGQNGTVRAVVTDFGLARARRDEKVAATTRMLLARLSIEEGRPAEAAFPLREAMEAFQKDKADDEEAAAHALLARSLLAQGRADEAGREVARARALIAKKKNPAVRFAVTIAAARVEAAAGRTAPASSMLEQTAAEARRLGFQELQLEARLAQGELEAASGRASSDERLEALEQEAWAKGFGLIAARAAGVRR